MRNEVVLGKTTSGIEEYKMSPAYSSDVGHAFQSKADTDSRGSRTLIPVIPDTLVGA
jgi:hypothetical protein